MRGGGQVLVTPVDDVPDPAQREILRREQPDFAQVGFGPGTYGPETLGIIFQPNKKQKAAGSPGAEYHYGNVTFALYEALLMADNVHHYFGDTIKSETAAYPYTKVA